MEYIEGLNGIPWNDDTRNMLQGLVDSSTQKYYCGGEVSELWCVGLSLYFSFPGRWTAKQD